jgi:hypothetical protein
MRLQAGLLKITLSLAGNGTAQRPRRVPRFARLSARCSRQQLARISHQAARELEVNPLNLNKLSEIDFFTVCFTPRSFGAGTPRAALGTFLPASLRTLTNIIFPC